MSISDEDYEELARKDRQEVDRFRKGWFGFTNYGLPTLAVVVVIAICGGTLWLVGQ